MDKLNELLTVIVAADKRQIANTEFHLDCGYNLKYKEKLAIYERVKLWATQHRLEVDGAFSNRAYTFTFKGLVLRKNKSSVFVYFD